MSVERFRGRVHLVEKNHLPGLVLKLPRSDQGCGGPQQRRGTSAVGGAAAKRQPFQDRLELEGSKRAIRSGSGFHKML
jgi:hypothetical protein